MRECDNGTSKTALAAQRAQVWRPILTGNDQEPAVHSHSFFCVLMRAEKMRGQSSRAAKPAPVLDHARFTAGVIGLYETVLSEPVPERMLRLIEAIRKQEKS